MIGRDLAASARKAQKHALKLALVQTTSKTVTKRSSASASASWHKPSTQRPKSGPVVVKAAQLCDKPFPRGWRAKRRHNKLSGGITKDGQHAGPSKLDAMEFVDAHRREIGRFGSKALDKRNKRAYEIEDLVKLGCRHPIKQKMPIGLLQHKRKKEKDRLAHEKEMNLASGMLIRSKRR